LAAARTSDDLLRVADDFPSTDAANWARLRAARILYDRAVSESLSNRVASDDDFKQAKELYSGLLKSDVPAEIREAALDGMARVLESTSAGDTAEAIAAYETLLREFPDTLFRDYAAHRIEELKKPETQEFYAWFSKQNPKPEDRPQPNDGATVPPISMPEQPLFDLTPPAKSGETSGESTTAGSPAGKDAASPPADSTSDAPPSSAPSDGEITPPATDGSTPAVDPPGDSASGEPAADAPPENQ
jgi:hypothetical protein